MIKTGWMNIYRSGWFHREGKPDTYDRHAGDIYDSKQQAIDEIDPPSHYIDTIFIAWEEPDEDLKINSSDSVPTPLSVSRKREKVVA